MLAAHAVIAAVLLGRARGWLEPAELVAYDQFIVAWAGEDRSDRIVLVTASEVDIGRYGWPLRDADLAALLERLTGWGARAIGVDIYRDRPVGPGGEVLDDLLRRHPEIYWVSKLPDAAADDQGVPPPAVLADSARAVLADVVLDAGGAWRGGGCSPRRTRAAAAACTAWARRWPSTLWGRGCAPPARMSCSAAAASCCSTRRSAPTRGWTRPATRRCSTSAAARRASPASAWAS
jgi:CHASE2 domain-containing sensor protein